MVLYDESVAGEQKLCTNRNTAFLYEINTFFIPLLLVTVTDCSIVVGTSVWMKYKEPCMVPLCAFAGDVPSCKLEEEGIQGVPMEGGLPFSVHPYASCPQWTLAWVAVDKTTISLNVLTLFLPLLLSIPHSLYRAFLATSIEPPWLGDRGSEVQGMVPCMGCPGGIGGGYLIS